MKTAEINHPMVSGQPRGLIRIQALFPNGITETRYVRSIEDARREYRDAGERVLEIRINPEPGR